MNVIHEHTNTPASSASVWASEMLELNALFRDMSANTMIGQCHRYSEYDNCPIITMGRLSRSRRTLLG